MTIDGLRSTVVVDNSLGGRRRLTDATRKEAAAAGGGAMRNAEMVCGVSLTYLVRGS